MCAEYINLYSLCVSDACFPRFNCTRDVHDGETSRTATQPHTHTGTIDISPAMCDTQYAHSVNRSDQNVALHNLSAFGFLNGAFISPTQHHSLVHTQTDESASNFRRTRAMAKSSMGLECDIILMRKL